MTVEEELVEWEEKMRKRRGGGEEGFYGALAYLEVVVEDQVLQIGILALEKPVLLKTIILTNRRMQ